MGSYGGGTRRRWNDHSCELLVVASDDDRLHLLHSICQPAGEGWRFARDADQDQIALQAEGTREALANVINTQVTDDGIARDLILGRVHPGLVPAGLGPCGLRSTATRPKGG